MNKLNKEISSLKSDIEGLLDKGSCSGCHKTLFFYDDNYLYVKCKHCKKVNQYVLEKSIKKM